MRKTIVRLVLFGVVAILAAGASAQEKRDEVNRFVRPEVPATGLDQITAQIPEEILIRFVDEPSHHFGLARERFLKKDYAQSAAEIRKGAGFVKLEAARGTSEGQTALADAEAGLEKLAGSVESGSVTTIDEIDAALARAELKLALHHELKAQEYWQADNSVGTGHDLKAASMSLKNTLKYSGGKMEAETEAAIKDANEIGQKLREGANISDERVNEAINMLGDKIDEIGEKMEQPKK
jgi:hypothetical protein